LLWHIPISVEPRKQTKDNNANDCDN